MSGRFPMSSRVKKNRAAAFNRAQAAVDKKFVKKKTAKGAYGKGAKKQMGYRRRPFVETKTVSNADLGGKWIGDQEITKTEEFSDFNIGSNFMTLNPHCFYVMRQGLDEGHMVGRQIYSRLLACKLMVRFPQGTKINSLPNGYELIWGWIPHGIFPTGVTAPPANAYNSSLIQATVITKIGEYFNNREDKLTWIPKGTDQIRIVGRRKVRPDLRYSLNPDGSDGYVPDYFTSFKWDVKHKLTYTPGQPDTTGNPGAVRAHCLTQNWIPFAVLYNGEMKDPESEDQLNVPKIAYNFQHYYTDS